MKKIFAIFKKDVKRVFTDRRMLMAMILPGVLLFVIYTLLGVMVEVAENPDHTFTVYVLDQPAEFAPFSDKETSGMDIEVRSITAEEVESVKEKVSSADADLLMIYDADFLTKVAAYDSTSGNPAPEVRIYYNSTDQNSTTIMAYYNAVLDSYESTLANKFNVNSGAEKYDLANEDDVTKSVISSLLPYFIVIMLFSGCMMMTADCFAGEKERGTMATLLVTPINRRDLAIGKVMALSVSSLVPALTSLLGIGLALPGLMRGLEINMSVYGVGTFLQLALVVILMELTFNVLLAIISAVSKTVKEAQSYSAPVMILIMVALLSTVLGVELVNESVAYYIPIYSLIISLTAIFKTTITGLQVLTLTLVNLVAFFAGVAVLARMLKSEKIMFNT